eukprot:7495796-Pyramimonas_sp.AAC.1
MAVGGKCVDTPPGLQRHPLWRASPSCKGVTPPMLGVTGHRCDSRVRVRMRRSSPLSGNVRLSVEALLVPGCCPEWKP